MGKGGGGREGLIYKEEMGKVFHYTCNFKSSKSSIGGRRGNFMLEKLSGNVNHSGIFCLFCFTVTE